MLSQQNIAIQAIVAISDDIMRSLEICEGDEDEKAEGKVRSSPGFLNSLGKHSLQTQQQSVSLLHPQSDNGLN